MEKAILFYNDLLEAIRDRRELDREKVEYINNFSDQTPRLWLRNTFKYYRRG